jgi:alkylhydroperoxidase family enzyme
VGIDLALTALSNRRAHDTVESLMDTPVTPLLKRFAALWRVFSPVATAAARTAVSAGVLPAYAALARYRSGAFDLEPRLRLLATQLAAERSGCRWCIDKGRHLWREARLPLDLLHAIPQFETSERFSARERATLCFTDALTRYAESDGGMPVEPLATVREHLSEPEVAALTAAVAAMHFFNPITGELGADAEPRSPQTSRSAWGAPIGTSIRSLWL